MWIRGKCPVIWNQEFKDFDYVRQPITGAESDTWREQGYTHETTTGKMYGSIHTMPTYTKEVAKLINLKNCGFVFYKLTTLDIMPNHIDHFNTYCEIFNVKRDDVYRALVFLEDWAPGQYLEVNHKALTSWKAGDFVLWQADVDHASANIGVTDRYALQLTGTLV